jgi:hypothetical protein
MPSNPDLLLGFGWVAEIEWGSNLGRDLLPTTDLLAKHESNALRQPVFRDGQTS